MVTTTEGILNVEDRAWLAATLDSEASIVYARRKAKGRNGKELNQPHYRGTVTVYTRDQRLVDELIKRTGIERVYRSGEKGKAWRMVSGDIKRLGPQIVDLMFRKQDQLRLMLEALELAEKNTPIAGQPFEADEEALNRRNEIAREISKLNHRTPKAGQ